ncbi:MAG: phosphatidylglycerol lysyltransferase domain-containing protein [Spirochaetes bacterium]|nr:phosphatidylglycerol lysyltransferase domain-containing protein [Spirochaetota bacterium]
MSQETNVPGFPEFAPINLGMKNSMYPSFNLLKDGISEFTFANFYLFRNSYDYRISSIPSGGIAIEGIKAGKSFFCMPCCPQAHEVFDELMEKHDYMKNFSESQVQMHRIDLEARGYIVQEDRDNFDYLYNRSDLAELSGKEYHKKRNLVNGFINSYECVQEPLRKSNLGDAHTVLDQWREVKGYDGDFKAAKESLDLFEELGMRGAIYYIEGKPAGWCLGEPLAKGRMFAVHFEKAIDSYKGIYQFINQAFAQSLPVTYNLINREQDLGNEGLRQAKMTYRPCGFVKKYRVIHPDKVEFFPKEVEGPADCGPGTVHEC